MDGKPHVHEFVLERGWCAATRPIVLRYGDQEVTVGWWSRLPSQRQLERAKKRIVKRHDRASRRAATEASAIGKLGAPAFDGDHWPSEVAD